MKYIYVFIKNIKINDALKYGMKLTEYADKIINISDSNKKYITGFLSPKDSILYFDTNYTCLKIETTNLNLFVFNNTIENDEYIENFLLKFEEYKIGLFEDPIVIIPTTILPESIFLYNKILDTPNLVESSKEFFYEKSIQDMLENNYFSNYELYQMLLVLGEQKKIFNVQKYNNLRLYKDKKGNVYTRKSSF